MFQNDEWIDVDRFDHVPKVFCDATQREQRTHGSFYVGGAPPRYPAISLLTRVCASRNRALA